MLAKIKELFKPLPVVEQWALNNSKRCTADEIIAASIVQSFARDFDHWIFTGEFNQRHSHRKNYKETSLINKKKDIVVEFLFRQTTHSDGYDTIYKYIAIGCKVNGVRIDDNCFREIYRHWNNMVVKVKAAKEAADRAKANMDRNEAAWNLAEKLLGMKRNEHGALVPIKTAEESCEDCHSKTVMCRKHQYKEKQSGKQTKDVGHQSPGGGGCGDISYAAYS